MLLGDGTPVIGMTLRYDRLDNFWFCLLHELTHVARHLASDGEPLFVDDFDLRTKDDDDLEREADEWADNALIPPEDWDEHPAQDAPYPSNVRRLDPLGCGRTARGRASGSGSGTDSSDFSASGGLKISGMAPRSTTRPAFITIKSSAKLLTVSISWMKQ
jgi:hypothetical protein